MYVNPVIPKVSSGASSVSAVNIVPQYASVNFTGNEKAPKVHSVPHQYSFLKRAGLAMGALLGLAACPDGYNPKVDTIPPRTDINTSTATSTATTVDTAPSRLNAAWANAGIAMPTDGVPTKIEYDDAYFGFHSVETLDTAKTSDNTVVYNAAGSDGGKAIKTYTYDPTTGALNLNTKCPLTGKETNEAITMDADGYTVFTNKKTGKVTEKLRKITTGKVGVYDSSNKLVGTLDNYKNFVGEEGYLARVLNKAKNGIAYETKSEGRTVRGIMPDAPELVGRIIKAGKRAV